MNVLVRSLGTLVLVALLAGSTVCSHDNVIGPENQLLLSNVADNFQFKVSSLANVTQSFGYNWINTGDSASISNASNLIGGTASLTVTGPTGSVLYHSDLTANGAFPSMKGTAGTWNIRFDFSKLDGNVTIQILKAP